MLIDACPVQCGKVLMEREGMTVDRYLELTAALGVKKAKKLPSKDFEEQVYQVIRKEVDALLGKGGEQGARSRERGAGSGISGLGYEM